MPDIASVIAAAQRLSAADETALEIRVGMLDQMLRHDPALAESVDLEPVYNGQVMGALDDVRAIGRRIILRWNHELYSVVCSNTTANAADREAILSKLKLSEAAVVGAVAAALIGLGVPAPIAAAAAPFIVKRFIWPAKDELCLAWGEKIRAAE